MTKKHIFNVAIFLFILCLSTNSFAASESSAEALISMKDEIRELQNSPEFQENLKRSFERNKGSLGQITPEMAKRQIEVMEKQGYSFSKDYIKEIDNNISNPDKVREIFFFAIGMAVPPGASLDKEEMQFNKKQSLRTIEGNIGVSLEELTKALREQGSIR